MPPINVQSEIAGLIWKVEKPAGEVVQAGDIVLVIESMKMEIPVEAPQAGRIVELLAAEGETVAEGAILFRMETPA